MTNLGQKFWLASACLASLGLSIASTSVMAGAIIKYGDTYLGVNNEGQLNFRQTDINEIPAGFVPAAPGTEFEGLPADQVIFGLYRNGLGDATSPGCACEGWGVAATVGSNRIAGGANEDYGGAFGMSGGEFGSTSSTATSTVWLNGTEGGALREGGDTASITASSAAVAPDDTLLTVTHAFGPSLADGVFQVSVNITNNTDSAVGDLNYRRVMDWDIPPTEFNEFVTHGGVEANLESAGGNVRYASDNGFATWDPRQSAGFENSETVNVDFIDNGPSDHGSVFDFAFGELAAGDSRTFNIFYGSTGNEADAMSAIALLGADVFSLGQQGDSPNAGEPATFLFAFGGVGGVEPGDSEDVPVLPFVTAPGEFVFTSPEPRRWFDPPYADGFEYALTDGALFTSVTLPSAGLGFGTIDVVVDGIVVATLTSDDGAVGGMDTFDFGAGVHTFSLVGLDMLLDIADPSISTAFPVFLDFSPVATSFSMSMVALEVSVSAIGVPEPAPIVVLLSGLVILSLKRNKKNR